jgi:hypothetical protein
MKNMSVESRKTREILGKAHWQNIAPYHCQGGEKTQFYVELEEKCKRRAAKEVSELTIRDEGKECRKLGKSYLRIPRYLKEENISKMENYLCEYYMESVYQNLWKKAQNAVFGGE